MANAILPPILAGPMLRRADGDGVSVWLALNDDSAVQVALFDTPQPAPSAVPLAESAWITPYTLDTPLHLALVTVTTPLVAGKLYYYDVRIADAAGDTNLAALGLLTLTTGALGYDQGWLPGFTLPGTTPEKLVIVHGSCRKPHGPGLDALAYLDPLLEKHRGDLSKRPQQLVLTGDQIYADDVAAQMLEVVLELTTRLFPNRKEQLPVGPQVFTADRRNFPPDRRQDLIAMRAGLTTTEGRSHLLSFQEFCAMYLLAWSPDVWPTDPLPAWSDQSGMPASDLEVLLSPKPDAERQGVFDDEAHRLLGYRDALAAIRRVLANIPTYMIFDDHEITDDWYLNGQWCTNVLTTELGRAVIRNGLAAYTLFQAWGNDPKYFATDPDGFDVHHSARTLFPITDHTAKATEIAHFDELLGLGKIATPGTPAPVARWHYEVSGSAHRLLVLDTRTHRGFDPLSPVGHPALIDAASMSAMLTTVVNPPPITIVVSPAPVLGVALMESVLQKGMETWEDINNGAGAGAIAWDAEAWAANAEGFEALLKALLPLLPNLVVLSGDVHYSFSTWLTYWKRNPQTNARDLKGRIVQLTSSSLKNHSTTAYGFLSSVGGDVAFANHLTVVARFGWDPPPPTITSFGPTILPTFHEGRLVDKPHVWHSIAGVAGMALPKWWKLFSFPPTTLASRDSDWSWRWHLAFDTRDDDVSATDPRPGSVGPQPLPADGFFDDMYVAVVLRHLWQLVSGAPRSIYWPTSFGWITFDNDGSGHLAVRHAQIALDRAFEFAGVDIVAGDLIAPVAHVIPLTGFTEVPPTWP
jgi:hypothetical protein